MKEPAFQFKQFSVRQDLCAMKIGVDSVLLGSWSKIPSGGRALDIGTGTGLLALMIAQRSISLGIKAIEIDPVAAKQATQNFKNSPWSERIEMLCADVKEMKFDKVSYHVIISNPPFFEINKRNRKTTRNSAREKRELHAEWIIENGSNWLTPNGTLNLVYPLDGLESLEGCIKKNSMHLSRLCKVYGKRTADRPKRVLLEISRMKTDFEESSISIRDNGAYTTEYQELTKDFYLGLKQV